MNHKKYRITVQKQVSYGLSCSPVDFDDFQEFVDYLRENRILKVGLGYFNIIDDSPNFYEWGIAVDDVTEAHFEWLYTQSFGNARHMEIISNEKKLKNEK